MKGFLAVILGLMAAFASVPARGGEEPGGRGVQEAAVIQGPLDYDHAARVAIRHSPYFTKSSLQVEVKRLDEKDARYDMVPSVNFRTTYYLDRPDQYGVGKPYSLKFISDHYNPVETYYSLQARKLFTQLAIFFHMQVIDDGLQRLGKLFLEMDCLKQVAAKQKDLVELARQNLDYVQNLVDIGTASSLDLKVATQELDAARAEAERLSFSQKRAMGNLKAFLGMKAGQDPNLNLKEAHQQISGRFDPKTATLLQAKNHSFDLKSIKVKKELQQYHVMIAKTKLLPNFFFGAVTADPLTLIKSREFFFYVGVDVPVWDGFKRLRNVSRQKTILKEYGNDANLKGLELDDKWNEVQENLRSTRAAMKAALAQEELARLRERQSEIRYESGGEPLTVYLDGQKGRCEAQKTVLLKSLDYDLAVLGLRHFSGDLGATYVDQSSWQQY